MTITIKIIPINNSFITGGLYGINSCFLSGICCFSYFNENRPFLLKKLSVSVKSFCFLKYDNFGLDWKEKENIFYQDEIVLLGLF